MTEPLARAIYLGMVDPRPEHVARGHQSAPGSARKRSRRLVVALVAGLPALAACEDEPTIAQLSPEALAPEGEAFEHYGQIRIQAENLAGDLSGSKLAVEARFAQFYGMNASFARSRANMVTPAVDLLAPGNCRSRAALSKIEQELAGDPLPPSLRELNLIDAGLLELSFDTEAVTIPYALVPDLVTWMSGLEYRWQDQAQAGLRVDPTGDTPLELSWSGSADADLPAHHMQLRLPPAIRDFTAHLQQGATGDASLRLHWADGRAFGWPLLVVFRAQGIDADAESAVVCAVEDVGDASLAAAELREAGVDLRADIEVTAIRLRRVSSHAGAFQEIDVVLESRESAPLTR